MDGVNFKADTSLNEKFQDISVRLVNAGWTYFPINICQGNGYSVTKFGAFIRDVKNQLSGEKSIVNHNKFFSNTTVTEKNERLTQIDKPSNHAVLNTSEEVGVGNDYGYPIVNIDPHSSGNAVVKSLGDIPTVARMKEEEPRLVIAIDTEFVYDSDGRKILTWQFAFSDYDTSVVHQVVFFSVQGDRLTLGLALSWLISFFQLYRLPFCSLKNKGFQRRDTRRWVVPCLDDKGELTYVSCNTYEEALETCNVDSFVDSLKNVTSAHKLNRKVDGDVGYVNDYCDYNDKSLPITLLCHTGIADLTGFGFTDFDKDVLRRVSSVSGGLVSILGFYTYPSDVYRYWNFYPIHIVIRDTMCFAPAKKKSLDSLGKSIGVEKLSLMDGYSKDDMRRYMLEQPAGFMEYAVNDALVTLLYASELWGYNKSMPLTVSGAAVKASVPVLQRYFGLEEGDKKGYNMKFRGLKSVKKGLIPCHDRPGYIEDTSLVPVSDDAKLIQSYAQEAYKGGYNASTIIGWYEGMTYDYDLRNAYPTSMALCMDIDWMSDKVVAREWRNEQMLLEDFRSPYDPIFGNFKFKFPENVKYPCIPVKVEGNMLYARSYENSDGVYACGPEIYLALCLGAEVTAVRAVKGKYRLNKDNTVSYSLRAVVKDFINDRNLAKKVFGEDSLPETLLKTAVNSLYGKTAQDIIEKETWDAYRQQMVNIGGSAMTSPAHASIITAGVRACLLAAMNELNTLGYRVFSVTTDGFISDAPETVIKNLGLYGFRTLFETARFALTGDPSMWQLKHAQNGLLNFTTRGNVALNTKEDPVIVSGKAYAGVCAHNSFVTGYTPESYDDRLSLTQAVLSRTGRCECTNKSFAGFKEVSSPTNRKDFTVTNKKRKICMDFDVKRKPVVDTMTGVYPVLEGNTYEIANFETAPYESVDEFLSYKKTAISCAASGCLRTVNDWNKFYVLLENRSTGKSGQRKRSISDMEWSRIISLVMGYRFGFWDIPYLSDKNRCLNEKISFINGLNKSGKRFNKSDWKNCRRPERKSQMLDKKYIMDLLEESGAVIIDAA